DAPVARDVADRPAGRRTPHRGACVRPMAGRAGRTDELPAGRRVLVGAAMAASSWGRAIAAIAAPTGRAGARGGYNRWSWEKRSTRVWPRVASPVRGWG